MTFVLDTSVTVTWCFEDEARAAGDQILSRLVAEGAIVPGLWSLEVANVLAVATRRSRLDPAMATRFLTLIGSLPIEEAVTRTPSGRLYDLATRWDLSAYDAAYLDLALREGLKLATFVESLAAAARRAGVSVIA